MMQARAALRNVEQSIEALEPLAVSGEMRETLSTIVFDCNAASGHCKRVYDQLAKEAFKPDPNAKENDG